MHDCQKHREDLTDLVLSGRSVASDAAQEAGIGSCDECRNFYSDALDVVRVMNSAEAQPPEPREEYWAGFEIRLRRNLIAGRGRTGSPAGLLDRFAAFRSGVDGRWLMVAASAAAVAAMTLVLDREMPRERTAEPAVARIQLADDGIAGLDPGTVDYLEQSELFLRSFVRMEVSDLEDLSDARDRAKVQLAGLTQRKEAASTLAPVQSVLDEYETILRDIHNLGDNSVEDIRDIQGRIEKNGLIANIKVYQPRLVVVAEQQ